MVNRREREDREDKAVSAKRRVTEHSTGFERTTLEVPEGTNFFQLKQSGVKRLEIIPYIVGKGNPFADEGEKHYERTYYVHRSVGANNDTYCCPAKNWKKPC